MTDTTLILQEGKRNINIMPARPSGNGRLHARQSVGKWRRLKWREVDCWEQAAQHLGRVFVWRTTLWHFDKVETAARDTRGAKQILGASWTFTNSFRFLPDYIPKAAGSESGGTLDNSEMNWRALSLHYDQLLHAICRLLSARSFA